MIMDNMVVTYIQTQTKLSPKQAQWMETLGEFDFIIRHKPGLTNVVADALSRKDLLGISTLSNDNWLSTIHEITKKLPPIKGLTMKDGLLYKGQCLFIPQVKEIKMKIIQENHDITGAHFRYKKTLTAINCSYYWKKQAQDV